MLDIFYKDIEDKHYSISYYPKLNYLRNMFNSMLYGIKIYYSTSNRYVKRPNMLVSLLENLNIDLANDPVDVYNELSNTAIYESNNFHIVTGINENSTPLKDNVIDKSKEYFLYISEEFDYYNKNYNSFTSLKCIYSSNDVIFLTHPKTFKELLYKNYYIYTIDPVKLGMQYYWWCKDMLNIEKDIDPARFIYEVILTNVIDSITDMNLLKRYMNFNNNILLPFRNDNPFMVKDFTKYIDDMISWTYEYLNKKNNLYYKELLMSIPMLVNKTAYDTLLLPDGYFNKRSKWLLYLSRLEVLVFMFSRFPSKKDKDTLYRIEKIFNYNNKNKYFITDDLYTRYFLKINIDDLLTTFKNMKYKG